MKKSEIKQIIKRQIEKLHRFPKTEELMDSLGIKRHTVQKILKLLVDDKFLQLTTNNWYELVPEKQFKINTSLPMYHQPEQIKNKIEMKPILKANLTTKELPEEINAYIGVTQFSNGMEGVKNEPQKIIDSIEPSQNSNLAIYTIKWGMLILGIGSIIISIYYNTLLALQFLPGVLAVIAGCIFVLFSVIAFEAMLLFLSYKLKQWKRVFVIAGFLILWLTAAVYSMTSTVNGRYERYMQNTQLQSSDNRTINAGRLKWANIQERKTILTQRIIEKRKQISQLYGILAGVKDLTDREKHGTIFSDTQWRISLSEKELDRYNNDLLKVQDEEANELKLNPESTDADIEAGKYNDFYEWLGTIFNISKEKIHFFLSLFPAFFFDVISPVAIACFLFLKRN